MWIVTLLSLTGVVLNIHKRRECYLVWLVTNLSWMIYDWMIGAWEQSALFAVYLILSVWGFVKWTTKPYQETRND